MKQLSIITAIGFCAVFSACESGDPTPAASGDVLRNEALLELGIAAQSFQVGFDGDSTVPLLTVRGADCSSGGVEVVSGEKSRTFRHLGLSREVVYTRYHFDNCVSTDPGDPGITWVRNGFREIGRNKNHNPNDFITPLESYSIFGDGTVAFEQTRTARDGEGNLLDERMEQLSGVYEVSANDQDFLKASDLRQSVVHSFPDSRTTLWSRNGSNGFREEGRFLSQDYVAQGRLEIESSACAALSAQARTISVEEPVNDINGPRAGVVVVARDAAQWRFAF